MSKGQLKNYRARKVTLRHLQGAQQKHALSSEAATIKVALALLEARAPGPKVWSTYQGILREEQVEKDAKDE